tara:strand:+ start:341 stop:667 length:327 start_codon:yes stop_codon:yes gene_type:complete
MEKIIAMTFDIADQRCKMYNALEWHNFIADTREYCEAEDADLTLEELFDSYYGDEFWYEVGPYTKNVYQVAFDLASEEFVICDSDTEVDFVMTMAEDGGSEEELFWAE